MRERQAGCLRERPLCREWARRLTGAAGMSAGVSEEVKTGVQAGAGAEGIRAVLPAALRAPPVDQRQRNHGLSESSGTQPGLRAEAQRRETFRALSDTPSPELEGTSAGTDSPHFHIPRPAPQGAPPATHPPRPSSSPAPSNFKAHRPPEVRQAIDPSTPAKEQLRARGPALRPRLCGPASSSTMRNEGAHPPRRGGSRPIRARRISAGRD